MKAYAEELLDRIKELEAENDGLKADVLGLKHELNNIIVMYEEQVAFLRETIRGLKKCTE